MTNLGQWRGLKPREPVINGNHPITRGLVFDGLCYEGRGTTVKDFAGGLIGTVNASGATWEQNYYGNDLVYSAAASSVDFTLPSGSKLESLTQMSYEMLVDMTGLGGSSLGRIFQKGSTNGYFLVFASSSTVLQINNGRNTTAGVWTFPFTENVWHHIVVTYDSSSTSNNPVVYVDGLKVTVTTSTAPVGTVASDNADFGIGNRVSDHARNWAGKISYVRAWSRILNQPEVTDLNENPWCIYRQPGLLNTSG